jgi:hypothetical protein
MHQKLADFYFEVLKHLVCSPDLTPSDYHLFSNLKIHHMGRKLSIIEVVILAVDGWFAAQPLFFFWDEFKKSNEVVSVCVAQGKICRVSPVL